MNLTNFQEAVSISVEAAILRAATDDDLIVGYAVACPVVPTPQGLQLIVTIGLFARHPLLGNGPICHLIAVSPADGFNPDTVLELIREGVEALRVLRASIIKGAN